MTTLLDILPQPPAQGHNMSAFAKQHLGDFTRVTSVEHLASLSDAPDALRSAITDERRKRGADGANSLQTILNQNEVIGSTRVDSVTGLLSRKAFDTVAQTIFDKFQPGEISVVYLDLNGLKRVNDTTPDNHATGDSYLKAAATSVMSGLRPTDLVYRVGGDEFIALLDGAMKDKELKIVTERLKLRADEFIAELSLPEGLYTGLSVGGAIKREGESLEDFIIRADQACEVDKSAFYSSIVDKTGLNLRR